MQIRLLLILWAWMLCLSPTLAQADLAQITSASLTAHPAVIMTEIRQGRTSTSDFVQGVPGDDLELSAVFEDMVLTTGERAGFDIINAVNPADNLPGTGLAANYAGSRNGSQPDRSGDRFMLGDHLKVYYLGDLDGNIDHDFARIADYESGAEIYLHGTPADYTLLEVTTPEPGTAIFYHDSDGDDLIGFIQEQQISNLNHSAFVYRNAADAPDPVAAIPDAWDQLGGAAANMIMDVALDDDGNVFVVGATRENLRPLYDDVQGTGRLFVARYNAADGSRAWVRAFGSENQKQDFTFSLDVDGGYVYTAGRILSSSAASSKDIFLAKIDANSGALDAYVEDGGRGVQWAGSIAADNGDFLYIAGIYRDHTIAAQEDQDPFLEKRRKSDLSLVDRLVYGGAHDGGPLNKEPWNGLIFVPDDSGIPGSGNIYTVGWLLGSFYGEQNDSDRDAWISAIDSDMNLQWVEQWGSSTGTEWAWDVAADRFGNLYVAGITYGNMTPGSHIGEGDGFISKFSPNGDLQWTEQIGSPETDEIRSIEVVGNRLIVAGHTFGDSAGVNQGESDLWVARLDLDGNLVTQTQLGTAQDDRGFMAANRNAVFVGGLTLGSLGAPNQGYIDAFLVKLDANLNVIP